MDHKVLAELEHFEDGQATHVLLHHSDRVRVMLLCLAPGAAIDMHQHPGFELTLTPLHGKGMITSSEGGDVVLEPGTIHFVGSDAGVDPHNPFDQPFAMLVHRIKI
jgi:quercetin dioxygenase-like cupin family protein